MLYTQEVAELGLKRPNSTLYKIKGVKNMISVLDIEKDNLPVTMESKEAWEKIIGKDRICEGKFYQLLNRPGCPKIKFGRKYLIPTRKFIEWLENEAISA